MSLASSHRDQLRRALAQDGWALLRGAGGADRAAHDPWAFVGGLWGTVPSMVEVQPIRPVPHGRSFASTSVETPLHTDSQNHLDAPPRLQLMICERPAEQGGETVLVDAWPLLERIQQDDPRLGAELFEVVRRIPFVFGDVFGPTVSLRGGGLVITHSPIDLPKDPVATRLKAHLARAPRIVLAPRAGDVLVVDNHRMLHGRHAFADPGRAFLRLLAWTGEPSSAPTGLVAVAHAAAANLRRRLGDVDEGLARALGISATVDPESSRLGLVLELLRGRPPGVIARREGVAEPELYRWRNAALRAAADALDRVGREPAEAQLEAALRRLQT